MAHRQNVAHHLPDNSKRSVAVGRSGACAGEAAISWATQAVSSINIDNRSDHDCATVAPYLGQTGDHFGRIEPHPDHGMGLERWRMFSHQPKGLPASCSHRSVSMVMLPPNNVWSSTTGRYCFLVPMAAASRFRQACPANLFPRSGTFVRSGRHSHSLQTGFRCSLRLAPATCTSRKSRH